MIGDACDFGSYGTRVAAAWRAREDLGAINGHCRGLASGGRSTACLEPRDRLKFEGSGALVRGQPVTDECPALHRFLETQQPPQYLWLSINGQEGRPCESPPSNVRYRLNS